MNGTLTAEIDRLDSEVSELQKTLALRDAEIDRLQKKVTRLTYALQLVHGRWLEMMEPPEGTPPQDADAMIDNVIAICEKASGRSQRWEKE